MKVKMLKMTTHNGNVLTIGEVYDISDEVAIRWKKRGIATVRKEDIAKLEEIKTTEKEVGESDVSSASDRSKSKNVSGGKRTTKLSKQNATKSK